MNKESNPGPKELGRKVGERKPGDTYVFHKGHPDPLEGPDEPPAQMVISDEGE